MTPRSSAATASGGSRGRLSTSSPSNRRKKAANLSRIHHRLAFRLQTPMQFLEALEHLFIRSAAFGGQLVGVLDLDPDHEIEDAHTEIQPRFPGVCRVAARATIARKLVRQLLQALVQLGDLDVLEKA